MNTNDARLTRYIKAVSRRLDLPRELRERVISDFSTTINARVEAGESPEEVLSSMGSPKSAAAELNDQMREYVCRRSPWRFAFLALAVAGLVGTVIWFNVVVSVNVTVPHSVAIIGGADGPTSILVAAKGSPELEMAGWIALMLAGIAGFILMSMRRVKKK